MVVVCQYFSEIALNIHQTNSRSHRTRACRLRHVFNSHGHVAFITEPVSPAIVALHALGTAVDNIGRRSASIAYRGLFVLFPLRIASLAICEFAMPLRQSIPCACPDKVRQMAVGLGLAKRHAGLRPIHPRQRRLPRCCPSQITPFLESSPPPTSLGLSVATNIQNFALSTISPSPL